LRKTMRYQSAALAFVFLLALLLPGLALAQEQPVLPAAYYGTVTLNGQPALAGTVIKAKIGGEVRGQITVKEAGKYGGPGPLDPKLIVNGTAADEGKPVALEVAGIQAAETMTFRSGDIKEVNLTANGAPQPPADTTPPAVASTDPANNATSVPVNKTISVTFSEDVQQGTNFGQIALKAGNDAVACSVTLNGKVLTIDPNANLAYSTKYTVTIPSGAVKDAAGNALAANYTFSFTTEAQPTGGGGGGGSGGGGGGAPAPSTPAGPTIGGNSLAIETGTNAQGQTVETITVKPEAAAQVEAVKKAGGSTVEIKVGDVKAEVAVINIPKEVLKSAAGMNVAIGTPQARLELPPSVVQTLAGQGLTVQLQKGDADAVRGALAGMPEAKNAEVLGTPTEIRTAIKGRTTVTIPLTGIGFPADPREREAFLAGLAVFVIHSDGEKQVVKGEIVKNAQGDPTGIRFTVDRFSTFAVIWLAAGPAATIVLTPGSQAASIGGKPYTLDAAPFVTANNRTMVPVRFVSEALGARVDWSSGTKQVLIKDGATEIVLTINGVQVMVNGRPYTLDAPAQVKSNRTFVPLRFVSETLGARVDYNPGTKQITISR